MSKWSLVVLLYLIPVSTAAEGYTDGTLTLDGLSFVSFEGLENLAIPTGSTVRFRVAEPENGVASFTIEPSDLSMEPIPLPGNQGTLIYTLASPVAGTIRHGENGLVVNFVATIRATLQGHEGAGALNHTLTFTTEHVAATGASSQQTVSGDGMQVVPGPLYVQIVGAVPNPTGAYPHPGRAVFTVLSGSFDSLPSFD